MMTLGWKCRVHHIWIWISDSQQCIICILSPIAVRCIAINVSGTEWVRRFVQRIIVKNPQCAGYTSNARTSTSLVDAYNSLCCSLEPGWNPGVCSVRNVSLCLQCFCTVSCARATAWGRVCAVQICKTTAVWHRRFRDYLVRVRDYCYRIWIFTFPCSQSIFLPISITLKFVLFPLPWDSRWVIPILIPAQQRQSSNRKTVPQIIAYGSRYVVGRLRVWPFFVLKSNL